MNPGALEEVEYETPLYDSDMRVLRRVKQRGHLVGRFAVRKVRPDEEFHDPRGVVYHARGYVIDHIPSGISVTNTRTFEDAMLIADDVSRFAVADADATNPIALYEQLGRKVMFWLVDMAWRDTLVPYREWLAQQNGGAE